MPPTSVTASSASDDNLPFSAHEYSGKRYGRLSAIITIQKYSAKMNNYMHTHTPPLVRLRRRRIIVIALDGTDFGDRPHHVVGVRPMDDAVAGRVTIVVGLVGFRACACANRSKRENQCTLQKMMSFMTLSRLVNK